MRTRSWAAFLSYAHAADKDLAVELQNALQQFAKPWNRLRAIDVFRDDSDLGATPHLWEEIRTALDGSQYFVLLASPSAAQSSWVSKECLHWLAHKSSSQMLIVLASGAIQWSETEADFDWSQTTALPACLRNRFANEPLIVDLRPTSIHAARLSDPAFRDAIARLASTIRDIPKSLLIGRDVEQHAKLKRARRVAVSGLIALAITSTVTAAFAFRQSTRAAESLRKTQIEESKLLALSSRQASDSGDSLTAIDLALSALPGESSAERPYVKEAEIALAHALYNQRYGRILLASLGAILDYDVHPAERIVAASGTNGAVVVWNADSGDVLFKEKFSQRPDIVRFSPRGDRILVVSHKGAVTLLAWPGGKKTLHWEDPSRETDIATFDREGEKLAVGTESGEVLIWFPDATKPIEMRKASSGQVKDLDFSPDGDFLVTTWAKGLVHLANLGKPSASRLLLENVEELNGTRFSADGNFLAVSSSARVQILEAGSGKVVRALTPTGGEILCSRFGLDSKRVVISDVNGGAWSWRIDDAEPPIRLTVKSGEARCPAFSSDGELVAIPSTDGYVSVWKYSTGDRVGEVRLHNGILFKVYFLAGAPRVVSAAAMGSEVQVWDSHAYSKLQYVRNGKEPIKEFALDGKSRFVLSRGADNSVYLSTLKFEIARDTDARLVASFEKQYRVVGNWASAIATTENSDLFAVARFNEPLQLWDVGKRTHRLIELPKPPGDEFVRSLSFTPLGDRLLVGTYQGAVYLLDTTTGKLAAEMRRGDGRKVNKVALSRDGRFAAAAIESDLFIFDAVSGRQLSELRGEKRSRFYVHFSKDSRRLVSGGPHQGYDITHLGESVTHERRETFRIIQNANFDPAGEHIVTASWDHTASIDSVSDPDDSRRLEGHSFWVRHAEFGREGSLVVTGADDSTARLWDVQTGLEIAAFPHVADIEQAEVTPDGKMLVTLADGQLSVLGLLPSGRELIELGIVTKEAFIPSPKVRAWLHSTDE